MEYQIQMFCALIFLPYVKNRVYSNSIEIDNYPNTSSDNPEPEIELTDFSI